MACLRLVIALVLLVTVSAKKNRCAHNFRETEGEITRSGLSTDGSCKSVKVMIKAASPVAFSCPEFSPGSSNASTCFVVTWKQDRKGGKGGNKKGKGPKKDNGKFKGRDRRSRGALTDSDASNALAPSDASAQLSVPLQVLLWRYKRQELLAKEEGHANRSVKIQRKKIKGQHRLVGEGGERGKGKGKEDIGKGKGKGKGKGDIGKGKGKGNGDKGTGKGKGKGRVITETFCGTDVRNLNIRSSFVKIDLVRESDIDGDDSGSEEGGSGEEDVSEEDDSSEDEGDGDDGNDDSNEDGSGEGDDDDSSENEGDEDDDSSEDEGDGDDGNDDSSEEDGDEDDDLDENDSRSGDGGDEGEGEEDFESGSLLDVEFLCSWIAAEDEFK